VLDAEKVAILIYKLCVWGHFFIPISPNKIVHLAEFKPQNGYNNLALMNGMISSTNKISWVIFMACGCVKT
jgi:hypothetical protein